MEEAAPRVADVPGSTALPWSSSMISRAAGPIASPANTVGVAIPPPPGQAYLSLSGRYALG